VLDTAASVVLACWHDLDTCRVVSGEYVGPIPWTAIVEWARMLELELDVTLALADAIRIVDADRMERIASEKRTKQKPGAKRK
jgi:hypothetical protein